MQTAAILAALFVYVAAAWWGFTHQARKRHADLAGFVEALIEALRDGPGAREDLASELSEFRRRLNETDSNFELLKSEVREQFNKVRAAEQRVRRLLHTDQRDLAQEVAEEVPPWEIGVPEIQESEERPMSKQMLEYQMKRSKR